MVEKIDFSDGGVKKEKAYFDPIQEGVREIEVSDKKTGKKVKTISANPEAVKLAREFHELGNGVFDYVDYYKRVDEDGGEKRFGELLDKVGVDYSEDDVVETMRFYTKFFRSLNKENYLKLREIISGFYEERRGEN